MSAVAIMLRNAGWRVTGSDYDYYEPVSGALRRAGLPFIKGYRAENIASDIGLVVIGKHAKLVPESNPEVAEAFRLRDLGRVEVRSYPEVLHELTRDTTNLVVTGSYGKSTTASLAAWVLVAAGKDPSWFLGAVPIDLPAGAGHGQGSVFVLEGDEYPSANWDPRPKFLHYNPRIVVLTSLAYDHVNVFQTVEDYRATYRELVRALPSDGVLVACADGEGVLELAQEAPCQVITYGREGAWSYRDVARQGDSTTFGLVTPDGGARTVQMTLLGEHNAQNVTGVAAALLGNRLVSWEQFEGAVARFQGIRRRAELRTPGARVLVYEDLSSSAVKARAFLAALRAQYRDARIVALFQPHTFSFRSRRAAHWYQELFADASEVLLFSPPELEGLSSDEQLGHDEIAALVRGGNDRPVTVVRDAEETLAELESRLRPGDVLAMMTSGGMGDAVDRVVSWVNERFPA
ncbi:MAG: hypothetical protein KIS66_00230 [Fimbriimonadaceae bacterium]|nr:hypothetical protein [Fimbriimonadaceae bacterium]